MPGLILRRRVEGINRRCQPQKIITSRFKAVAGYLSLVDTLPLSRGAEAVELHYFHPHEQLSDLELQLALSSGGLSSDPLAQLWDNINHPEFSKAHPNGFHWPDSRGWRFMAFYWSEEKPCVTVDQHNNDQDWLKSFWFAGVLQPVSLFRPSLLYRLLLLRH